MKKTILLFAILLIIVSSLSAFDYKYSVGALFQSDTKAHDKKIGGALDAALLFGKEESTLRVIGMERTNYLIGLKSSTFGFLATTYFGLHINPVGGIFIEPMLGVGFALYLSRNEGSSVFDVTGGGIINVGYGFGEGQNIYVYIGAEAQYAVLFFSRLFYSAHAGVGVRF